MSTDSTAVGPADAANLSHPGAGPTVLRMLVGAQLRRRRRARGMTPAEAGETIRASESKMSRLECGRTGFKMRDLTDLLTIYGVHDEAERATLLALAEQANEPGWWHSYGDAVPGWFDAYVGLEQAASTIRSYEVQFIPGLLQTEDYARAVIGLGRSRFDGDEVDRRVGLRMERQRRLRRADGAKIWTVIDEAALHRQVGDDATMRAQLRHIAEISADPRVTVQVIPFSAGGHPAAGGPFIILRFREEELPDVVYLEQLSSALYPDRPADIAYYWHVMNRLVIQARPPTATVSIVERVMTGR